MTTINFRMSKNKRARVIESVLVILFFCIQLLIHLRKCTIEKILVGLDSFSEINIF